MLRIDRDKKTLIQLSKPSLAEAQILERTDLQEYIFNSYGDFFTEIGENIFVVGKEISPSQTVQDRIDLLGIDTDGSAVIIELKRGSNKLHMLQAISYAGMVERWGKEDFRNLVSDVDWDKLTDFIDVDTDEINRTQRLVLISEGYDYSLLVGAEWLTEQFGVDIRCYTVTVARDQANGAEYLACTSVYPPAELADQAVGRQNSQRLSSQTKWRNWDDALAPIKNDVLKEFVSNELATGRENNLNKRILQYRLEGKRRWSFTSRNQHAYIWQRGRFQNDIEFWQAKLSNPESVNPKKRGRVLVFNLITEDDFSLFKQVVTTGSGFGDWLANESDLTDSDNK